MVCFRYAGRIDIKLDTGLGNLTWGLLPTGCQGVVRKEAPTDSTRIPLNEGRRVARELFTTEDFNFLFFNLTKGVSTMGMILKVVGQVKGHNEKMTMTLDVEALRNSLIKSKLTSKKIKTMANKSTRLANTKKWEDFKDFFEKKAEIQNSVSEIVSWSEREK